MHCSSILAVFSADLRRDFDLVYIISKKKCCNRLKNQNVNNQRVMMAARPRAVLTMITSRIQVYKLMLILRARIGATTTLKLKGISGGVDTDPGFPSFSSSTSSHLPLFLYSCFIHTFPYSRLFPSPLNSV